MNSSDWLKKSAALFSRKQKQSLHGLDPLANNDRNAKDKPALETLAAPARDSAPAPRSTAQRLNGKHLAGEALKPKALQALLAQLKAVVDPTISDVEGGRHAHTVAQWYAAATPAQRVDCWQLMSEQFGLGAAQMLRVTHWLQDHQSLTGEAEIALRRTLRCPRTALIQRFAAYADGVRFLIQLRADLLVFLRARREYVAALTALDTELQTLFTTWFDVAFLELRRISWDSPASLIEKLIAYEAVHHIKSWADVKNRLDSDRRCFGFFHPRLPDEPLIFVEVVFTQALASSMMPILDDTAASTDLSKAKCANFYSISNTQPGLKGLGFGDSLIKQVVQALQQELPHLKIFTTLSPIPTLRPWIQANAESLWLKNVEKKRKKIAFELGLAAADLGNGNAAPALIKALAALPQLPAAESETAQWLTQCAAQYLCHTLANGLPLDSVARFHLGNGAAVARLNWAADKSSNGVKQSYGLMVNYVYDLKRLDKHRAQLLQGKVASLSAVSSLAFE